MDRVERAVHVASSSDAGELARIVEHDPDPSLRAVALAQLVHVAARKEGARTWKRAACDKNASVRLRAAQLAPRLGRSAPNAVLLELLRDDDVWVAEAAAFALGEHPRPTENALTALADAATSHPDPLVREAAVAALGARGEPSTLPAVLKACADKPAIRRRAVLALAAFEGDEVEERLRAALHDRDWQVRQAAEDLLHE